MPASNPQQESRLSEAEYLPLEPTSTFKHEYLDGEVYVLPGASEAHNRLAMNVSGHLWMAARRTACRVVGSDMRLRVSSPLPGPGERVLYYYPDVQVVRDPADDNPLVKSRPCVIVEISSPSTEAIDAREKLLAYRGLASLQTYLIVAQDRRHVVRHYRDADGAWFKAEVSERGQVPIGCVSVVLDLDDIFEGVI